MNVFRRVLIALALVFMVVAGLFTSVTAAASQSGLSVASDDEEAGDNSYDIFIVDEAPDDDGEDEDEDEDE